MTLYNLKSLGDGYRMTKFDDDLNPIVESSYVLIPSDDNPSVYLCSCPASTRPSCRHRDMLPEFLANPERLNSNWFLDYSNIPGYKSQWSASWRQYIGPFADDGGEDSSEDCDDAETQGEPEQSAPAETQSGYIPFGSDKSDEALAPNHTDLTVSLESIEAFVESDSLTEPSFRRRV